MIFMPKIFKCFAVEIACAVLSLMYGCEDVYEYSDTQGDIDDFSGNVSDQADEECPKCNEYCENIECKECEKCKECPTPDLIKNACSNDYTYTALGKLQDNAGNRTSSVNLCGVSLEMLESAFGCRDEQNTADDCNERLNEICNKSSDGKYKFCQTIAWFHKRKECTQKLNIVCGESAPEDEKDCIIPVSEYNKFCVIAEESKKSSYPRMFYSSDKTNGKWNGSPCQMTQINNYMCCIPFEDEKLHYARISKGRLSKNCQFSGTCKRIDKKMILAEFDDNVKKDDYAFVKKNNNYSFYKVGDLFKDENGNNTAFRMHIISDYCRNEDSASYDYAEACTFSNKYYYDAIYTKNGSKRYKYIYLNKEDETEKEFFIDNARTFAKAITNIPVNVYDESTDENSHPITKFSDLYLLSAIDADKISEHFACEKIVSGQ